MTTIALDMDLCEIASDSQDTSESGQKYHCKKLFKVGDFIVATAGGSYAGLLFIEWFGQYESEPIWEERPDLINLDMEEDFECIVVRSDKTFYSVNRLFVPYEHKKIRQMAIGSGGKAARAAMMAGCTPTEAVKIAKEIDTYTGGRVVTMKFK